MEEGPTTQKVDI